VKESVLVFAAVATIYEITLAMSLPPHTHTHVDKHTHPLIQSHKQIHRYAGNEK